jgi:predicted DNA-binding antitoxin AbrB/MazE fold protein
VTLKVTPNAFVVEVVVGGYIVRREPIELGGSADYGCGELCAISYNSPMSQSIDAVFENGVFRPEQPVDIPNGQRVSLTVDSKVSAVDDLADIADLLDLEFVESCHHRATGAPPLEEVRRILSSFQGSMSELIVEERDER